MTFKYKRALVTGGAGFIGSHLVEALVSEGSEVVVIDDLSTGRFENLKDVQDEITFYHGDIRDRDLLLRAAENCEVIFHQAAVVSVPQTVEHPAESAAVNEMGTIFVFEAARNSGAKRVIFASSCAIYGDDPELPKDENMKPKPQSPYAAQKLAGEIHAGLYRELYDLEVVCLRYFNVYGPRQDPSSPYSGVISIFMRRALDGTRPVIYGDGNQYRDFIFVKDVIAANFLAANTDGIDESIFNVATGDYIRINRLWEMIRQLACVTLEAEYQDCRPGDIIESVADIDRARKSLRFEPRFTFEEGLKETMEWYRGMKNRD
ncbi:SDR family oxidoreductase [Thermodesulfobacteriota bacterium]